MENKTTILIVLLVAVLCAGGTYFAAGGSGEKNDATTVSVAGSTTVMPLMLGFQQEFEQHSNMTLDVTGGGSGAGVSGVNNGTADIGMLSRDLSSSDPAGLVPFTIARDGVVIVVDADTNVTNLTLEQLAKIYNGEYTNWNQVGGSDLKISPIIREDGSGTRDCIDSFMAAELSIGVRDFAEIFNTYSTQSSTNAMLAQVQTAGGAIGYVNLGADTSSSAITKITIDGIHATAATVLDGSYELSRNLVLITKGQPDGNVAFFLSWIISPQGQKIVEQSGFVSIRPTAIEYTP